MFINHIYLVHKSSGRYILLGEINDNYRLVPNPRIKKDLDVLFKTINLEMLDTSFETVDSLDDFTLAMDNPNGSDIRQIRNISDTLLEVADYKKFMSKHIVAYEDLGVSELANKFRKTVRDWNSISNMIMEIQEMLGDCKGGDIHSILRNVKTEIKGLQDLAQLPLLEQVETFNLFEATLKAIAGNWCDDPAETAEMALNDYKFFRENRKL